MGDLGIWGIVHLLIGPIIWFLFGPGTPTSEAVAYIRAWHQGRERVGG